MKIRKITLGVLAVLAIIVSCGKDDDDDFVPTPLRDRTLQQAADRDSLLGYLETHYFNSSTFDTPGNYTIEELVITELPKDTNGNYLPMPDPDLNTLLIDSPFLETLTTEYLDVTYEYYVLKLNQGGGQSPHFTDQIRVVYTGSLMDGTVFDSAINPVNLEMVNSQGFGVIEGWKNVFPDFKTASSFNFIGDGTISYSDYGFGAMFLPSGLAYYGQTQGAVIAPYSNLIFKFALYQSEVSDHDNDGIPSFVEDVDNNLDVINDDTDGDFRPNYVDIDDDNDGVLTINELQAMIYIVNTNEGDIMPILAANEYERSRENVNGIITLNTVIAIDSNSNSIPDYLEVGIANDYNN